MSSSAATDDVAGAERGAAFCSAVDDALKNGKPDAVRVESFEFGIFREGDRLVAYENHCPHDGGPVCQGKVIPRVEEELAPDQTSRGLRFSKKRNIVCPWHGWEFDIESGRHCGDPKYRLRPVDVRVRDNRVYVSIPPAA